MLDRLPRPWRHLLIGVLYVALQWAAAEGLPAVSPWLDAHPPLGPLAGVLAAQLLLVVLPLVRYRAQPGAAPDDAPRHAAEGQIDRLIREALDEQGRRGYPPNL